MKLRRTLLNLVLAAAPLSSGCFVIDDDPCSVRRERELRVAEPPPQELELVLRACEADESKCLDFCNAALNADTNGNHPYAADCVVEHDATGHDLTIGYYVSTGNSGCPVEGRRPAGLQRAKRCRASVVGTHLARSAWFEAASVHAFVGLARELARHGAPAELTREAQVAAVDEIRHARAMSRLARSRGATPPLPEVAPLSQRTIEEIATENAVEGLVGETWAALVATWQGAHAPAEVRETFAEIAVDETSHAELSRRVHAWAMTRLSKTACRRVEAARRRAIRQLRETIGAALRPEGVKPDPALVRELGMPDAQTMQKLFDGARAQLWS